MKRRVPLPVAVFGIVSMFLFAGCFGVDGNFKQLRNDLLSVQDAGFSKDIEFSLGSTGLALVKAFVNHNNKDDNAKEILKYVSKIQVCVYKNNSHSIPAERILLFKEADFKMQKYGWEAIVKNSGNNKMNLVYVMKNNDDEPVKMFVISLNRKELVMVEVSGDLEKVLVAVIKDKGMKFQYADVGN